MSATAQAKVTPAPWELDEGNYYGANVIRHNGMLVCKLLNPGVTGYDMAANARLIVSAHAMLKALKRLVACPEPPDRFPQGPLGRGVSGRALLHGGSVNHIPGDSWNGSDGPLHPDDGGTCTICRTALGAAPFVGDGDGMGQKFAHADCYHEREAKGRAELDKNDAAKEQEGRYIEHGPELFAAASALATPPAGSFLCLGAHDQTSAHYGAAVDAWNRLHDALRLVGQP